MNPDTQATSPQSPISNSPLGGRLLVGALTALIVARPLLAGDDPGRLRLTSGGGPLILNALCFLLLLAWGIWRIKARRAWARGPGAIVVFGLLAVAGLAFASAAGTDRYQRPGWFIAWDWLSIATLCFLTWQLTSTPAIARSLTAALIAMAACLSSQALYQRASVEFGLPTTESETPPPSTMPLVGDDEFGLNLDQPPPPRDHFRATFDQPETLHCFVLLMLWAASFWAMGAWYRRPGARFAIVVALPILIVYFFAAFLYSDHLPRVNMLQLIHQFPFLGGGPGNFSRMTGVGSAQPSNYWLGLAATTGLLSLGVVVLTLLVSLWLCRRRIRTMSAETNREELPRTHPEFYFGGVVGLLLGMMLATGDIPAESSASEILRLGVVAGVRTVIWLLAFFFLEKSVIKPRLLAVALFIGVVLVALAGCFSDALSSPALLQSFWLAVVLAVSGSNVRRNWSPISLPYAVAGVSLAIALLGANLMHVGVPGLRTATSVRSARQASQIYPHVHWNISRRQRGQGPTSSEDAAGYVNANILQPLRQAVNLDPKNSALLLELARWEREHWSYLFNLGEKEAAKHEALEMTKELPQKAAAVDPHNLGAILSPYTSVLQIAGSIAVPNKEQLALLDNYIAQISAREPKREVELRYRVVLLLLSGRNKEALESWSLQLLRVNVEPGYPHGHLSDEQRKRLASGIWGGLPKPSAELARLLLGVGE